MSLSDRHEILQDWLQLESQVRERELIEGFDYEVEETFDATRIYYYEDPLSRDCELLEITDPPLLH